jgi:hypothetical protein
MNIEKQRFIVKVAREKVHQMIRVRKALKDPFAWSWLYRSARFDIEWLRRNR